MPALVSCTVEAPVAEVCLRRPERHNSLVPELLDDLLARLSEVAGSDARVCLLTAEGRSFSTGGDIAGFLAHDDDLAGYGHHLVGLLNEAILALVDLPVPVVTAVQGPVTGGSLGLVLASDVVLVSERASFAPWYGVVGFSPDGGWTALLPDVIGRTRAADVLLTNRRITAEEAVSWGLATRQVPHDKLASEARAVSGAIAGMEPETVASTRQLLRPDRDRLAAKLEEERRAFVAQIVTAEARAGMRRFVEKERR